MRVSITGGCWNWEGALNAKGYGILKMTKSKLAHRVSYVFFCGKVPRGLTLDHSCRNKRCVNPAHLKPMTLKENILLSESVSAVNARKVVCVNGHALSGDNLHVLKRGERKCRRCNADRQNKYRLRKGLKK